MVKLRNYQEQALLQLGTTGEQVLSICPGGGKTLVALEYIKKHPKFKRVLILTHGTNVLKRQWFNVMDKLNLEYSQDILSNKPLIVTIPQALTKKEIPKFDLIVVDEAHEFYLADKMIKNIIKYSKPKCILLLTGTPSKLIKHGLTPIIVSGVDVYRSGNLSDTHFGLVKSKYNLKLDSFNDSGDVNNNIEFTDTQTIKSMDSLVKDMLSKLKSLNKNNPSVHHALKHLKVNKFQEVFTRLDKTLIAAKDIKQAKLLFNILQENGVKSVLSDSETDPDSLNVKQFQETPDIKVLVVVRRGVLGFNMEELVNVVDFTMSRNIDRIYQLYARVLRKHDKYPDKFFYRMCSAINPDVDAFYLQAAMHLNNLDFISKYNGKNLNSIPMLVPKRFLNKDKLFDGIKSGNIANHKITVDPILADEILSLSLLTDVLLNTESNFQEYAYMKFGEVIEKLTGKKYELKIKNITEENLRFINETGKDDPRIYE